MVFVNAKVLLPLLTALTAFAAPIDNANSAVSPAVDVAVDSDPTVDIEAATLLAGVTPMTSAQVTALTPYTYYASAGYCNPSVTKTWTCGANCNANSGFRPIASGGDGVTTQFCLWPFLIIILTVIPNIALTRVCWLRPNSQNNHCLPSRNRRV